MEEFMDYIKLLSTAVTTEEYSAYQEQVYELLVKLRDSGVDKDHVYRALSEYLNSLEDGIAYDFIADILDYVVGWCSPKKNIWNTT